MNPRSIARHLVLVFAAPILLSCGGGGGGDASDSVAPMVTLTAPANFAADLTGTVALAANASDNVAVTLVEFEVDGLPVGSDGSAPYAASVNTASYATGQHMVRVRARDAAGNVSAWSTATVRFGGNNPVTGGFTKDESFVAGLNLATAVAQAPRRAAVHRRTGRRAASVQGRPAVAAALPCS